MALKSDAKLEKPWHCGFKNGMKNWDYFHHQSTQKSENCTLMGSFCQKHKLFQLETFRGFTCHDTEGCCKVYIRNLVNFYASS